MKVIIGGVETETYPTALSDNLKIIQSGQTIQAVINSITDAAADNLYNVMVPPGHESEVYTNSPYITVTFLPLNIAEKIEQRTYGANLRRFLKKARDWRSEKRFARAPQIVLLGDSIVGGSWAEDFKSWLCTAYNIPVENFKIRAYGGYDIQAMLPFIDEMLIFPNPDLILFGEYATSSAAEEELMAIENLISLIRDRTTADIGILTWSMTDSIATAYLADEATLIDDSQYQAFNWYRDIAGVYNCELIDFNEAIKEALDAGYSVADLGMSGPHLSTAGYTIVHLPEIKKHFGLSNDQLALNVPYPMQGKEEILYLANAAKMELFNYSDKITLTGTWTTDNISLASGSVGDIVEIEMNDIVGFEILHGDDAGASIQLKESGGVYADPSTLQLNSRPLQYISEVISTAYPADWGNWKFKLPFKKGIVTANELADTEVKSGRYTINVNTIVGATITCEMFDPDDVSLGTFTVGQAATFIAGNLSFPQKYNGEDNYRNQVNFVVDEKYEFHIYNNWCDSLCAAEGPEIANGLPGHVVVNELPNIAEISLGVYHFKYVYGTESADKPKMVWNSNNGLINGHTYRLIYKEITREGTGFLVDAERSVVFNTPYFVETFVVGNSIQISRFCASGESCAFDVTFALSIMDITGSLEYEDTKKVYGLPRGDYVLKATVTAGGVDLFGVRLLHGEG